MGGVLNLLLAGAASAIKDAYFNLTTLLLNTSSTNGAQNNTFLDSSTNNFTITRNGNTTQGTFTPFSQTGWSNAVTTTGSYLTVTSQPLINVNDWTVEFWMYPTQFNNNGGIFGASNGGGTNPKLYLYVTGANLIIEGYSGGFFTALSTPQPTLNQWTYVSVSRSSSTGDAYIYYNGVLQGSAAAVPAITGITGGFSLLSNGEGSSAGFYGYMSNMRVSNVARYTGSSYSVPTAASTAIANTTLLTAQSNRFVDNSSNGYAIAVTGTPSVQAFSPFLPTAAYDTAVVGGSGYFDGTGDYLVAPNDTVFDFGSGNFTIEFWVYSNGDNEYMPVEKTINGAFGSWYIQVTSGSLKWNCSSTGSSNDMFNSVNVGTVPTYAWTHIAIVRSGTTFTGYINGVGTSLGTSSSAIYNSSYGITVGAHNGTSSYDLNGHIAGLRLIKGTAAYTSNFTPPTAPPTAITNTSLLLNFTNAGIIDNTAKNVLETVGNAQASTTQAKWGTTSMYFDGSGDLLLIPNNQMLNLNADFTIEFWIYLNSTSGEQCIFHNHNSDNNGVFVSVNGGGAGKIRLGAGNGSSFYVLIDSSTAINASTWAYVACTRSGSTWTVYINGSSAGTATSSSNPTFSTSDLIQIGRFTSGAPNALNAYIDDLRITKYARTITASPTAAFPLN